MIDSTSLCREMPYAGQMDCNVLPIDTEYQQPNNPSMNPIVVLSKMSCMETSEILASPVVNITRMSTEELSSLMTEPVVMISRINFQASNVLHTEPSVRIQRINLEELAQVPMNPSVVVPRIEFNNMDELPMNPSVSMSRIRIDDMREVQMSPTVLLSRLEIPANIDARKPKGMEKDDMIKLTIVQKFERKCAICLTEFEDGEDLRCLIRCTHVFHVKCVDEWLKDNKRCPMCRQFLRKEEEPL